MCEKYTNWPCALAISVYFAPSLWGCCGAANGKRNFMLRCRCVCAFVCGFICDRKQSKRAGHKLNAAGISYILWPSVRTQVRMRNTRQLPCIIVTLVLLLLLWASGVHPVRGANMYLCASTFMVLISWIRARQSVLRHCANYVVIR